MSRANLYILLLAAGLIISCNRAVKEEKTTTEASDSTRSAMFRFACENRFMVPDYVVVKVKNTLTGETKEICTEIQILNQAWKMEREEELNCEAKRDRYFEFTNDSALVVLNYSLYNESELEKYASGLDIPKIVEDVKTGRITEKSFPGYSREQIMFAHLMFNHGILMTRGRIIGNICALKYFDTAAVKSAGKP